MSDASVPLERRRRIYDVLAARFGMLGDEELAGLVASATSWRRGAGGESGMIDVDGEKVFVKKIYLTDLEQAPQNAGSTANLFNLPLFYQYGVGSAGFGAWRELAAYMKANAWVLSGECAYFPLVYHWRVLPRTAPSPAPDYGERLKRAVAYWNHSDAIGARLSAIGSAPAALTLFLEYVPETLEAWLSHRLPRDRGVADFEAAVLRAYDQLQAAAAFMNERGMLHFDLHALNVLTDGEQLYVGDFGLALCADFQLSPAEHAFFETHRLYDRGFVAMAFVKWLEPGSHLLAPAVNAVVDDCRPVADLMWTFLTTLRRSKTAPYPERELEQSLATQSLAMASSPRSRRAATMI